MAAKISARRRQRQRGSEMIEFTLLLFLVLGFLFMTIDIAWMVFTRATLQNAVFRGARYAMASRDSYANDPGGHRARIKQEVMSNSLGLIGASKANLIHVNWYDPTVSLSTPLSGTSDGNKQGFVVEVEVVNFSMAPLVPVFHDAAPFLFSARSSDLMQ